jgi:hypothetical protein
MGYKSPRTYTITGSATTLISPVDATAYYVGGSVPAIGTSAASRQIKMPKSGIIRTALILIYSATADGTNEAWTINLYDGTTTTAIAIVSAAAAARTWLNNNMNYPVTEGGYVQFSMTTPTWVTNPEGCTAQYCIIVEYE